MKVKPSIAFGEFSGTASEVTAKKSKGVQILSTRAKLYSAKTNSQTYIRSNLTIISRKYKTLTDEQLLSWETLAKSCRGKSSLGQYADLSAANLFLRLNSNLMNAGGTMLLTAPALTAVPSVSFSYFKFGEDSIAVKGLDMPSGSSTLVLAFKTTRGLSTGISSGWGKATLINPAATPVGGNVELLSDYQSKMKTSPVNGQKHFVIMYWLDTATGFTGVETRLSGQVSDTPWIGEAEDDPDRPRLTSENVDLDSHVESFDVELAPGSAIFTADITYNGDTSSSIAYNINRVPQRLVMAAALLPARKIDDHYRVSLFSNSIYNYNETYQFILTADAYSGTERHVEIFGTIPAYN